MHFYESMTIMTKDDVQIKTYSNEHPNGFIIGVPKYIPTKLIKTNKLQIREFDGKEYNRFNIRAIGKDDMKEYFEGFRKNYPDYFFKSEEKDTWFMGAPKEKISQIPDSKKGVKELLNKNENELDKYSSLTRSLIEYLSSAKVRTKSFGTTNSTLLGNYTYGKSDIDILVFGKKNYWKIIEFLENAENKMLRWRTQAEWKKHYVDYFPGMDITESEYVKHQSRKFSDGLWGETVFSVFGVSEPDDEKEKFDDTTTKHLGIVKIEAIIKEDFDSCVRPGVYEIEEIKVLEGQNCSPKRILSYTRNFVGQAKKGERVICAGMLEKVTDKKTGKNFEQITNGLFESYEKWKGKELLKVKW